MSRRWVVNASPLILLSRVDQLQLLRDLTGELVIPAGVAQEVRARPDGERDLEALVELPTVQIEIIDPIPRDVEVRPQNSLALYSPHLICRNHVQSGVTAIYHCHSYDAEKREVLEPWSTRVDSVVCSGIDPLHSEVAEQPCLSPGTYQ